MNRGTLRVQGLRFASDRSHRSRFPTCTSTCARNFKIIKKRLLSGLSFVERIVLGHSGVPDRDVQAVARESSDPYTPCLRFNDVNCHKFRGWFCRIAARCRATAIIKPSKVTRTNTRSTLGIPCTEETERYAVTSFASSGIDNSTRGSRMGPIRTVTNNLDGSAVSRETEIPSHG